MRQSKRTRRTARTCAKAWTSADAERLTTHLQRINYVPLVDSDGFHLKESDGAKACRIERQAPPRAEGLA